ncbi:hypothetical protein OIO90_005196 [Microbotryomycetes sp. JL221]|nr:hypothetical protein OIO90_005196 [Microbotryomycetes sp. JL221]
MAPNATVHPARRLLERHDPSKRSKARYLMYLVAFAVSCASFGMALAALLQPNWIIFETPNSTSPIKVHSTFGLYQRCDSSTWTGDAIVCRKFPTRSSDCEAVDFNFGLNLSLTDHDVDEYKTLSKTKEVLHDLQQRKRLGQNSDDDAWSFCDSWVTAGYAQQVALVFGLASVLASLIILLGGRQKRETGWKLISGLLTVEFILLIVSTSLIAHEYRMDDRFYYGSKLGQGYILSTVAWSLDVVIVGVLLVVGFMGLVKEDDYEQIMDD